MNLFKMRRFGVLSQCIFLSIVAAGLFGVIHDQITFSISREYFTKFKYQQFGFGSDSFGGDRQTVAAIGFLATWWVGLFIGLIFGFTGLIFPDHKEMFKAVSKSIALVLMISVLSGIAGFLIAKFHLVKTGVGWSFPDHLVDRESFIIVGTIHNFSYLGALTGLLAGVIYMLVRKQKLVRVKG
jgi:hypothetical protein